MSDEAAVPHPDETRTQFFVRPTAETVVKMENQRLALGFLSANAMLNVVAHEMADVPPSKYWEVLANIRRYARSEKMDTQKKGRRG